ncbi:MAG: glycosyltransferase family 2 protein [Lachnospiraceae bacterium]|nr:glycosyltransferase family 2 protein [Lachnospiraceae bacterium]
MDASIVIPVKNGGKRFEDVLKMIFAQTTNYTYEVICVDSGSSDDSVAVAKKYGADVYEIPPEEFGHGKTRNYGASLGTGEFIIFLTQDATPASVHWLDAMIDAMKLDEQIAGGFGKHLPYGDCNPPDRQMLENHFGRYGNENFIHELTEDKKQQYFEDEGYRQYLSFFSDNCSCLRRSVWEKIPYDDTDFSEDQIWARKILEAGYKKVYVPEGAVYHSHNYPISTYGQRYYDEFKALYRVQQASFCPDLKTYIRRVLGDTRYQCSYIKHCGDYKAMEKIKWYFYCLRRNMIRYEAAHRAVQYFSLSEEKQKKMDEKYSQQLKQIKG